MDQQLVERGFLPAPDPLSAFPGDAPYVGLDALGRELPALLEDPDFRRCARDWDIPLWPEGEVGGGELPALRLYYLRVGFLASGYINQVGQPPATMLPANLARPLCRACALLRRPPILSYDGYALYNWRRLDPAGPIALGNLDTLQNFVRLYDEHWFILVHVAIEAIAARILAAVAAIHAGLARGEPAVVDPALRQVAGAIRDQEAVLRRIPEHMDPSLYHRSFRPYIRYFEGVVYEGVEQAPSSFRGETGAQSSVVPVLLALLKVPHRPSLLTDHLADLRRYMPAEHQRLLAEMEALPPLRPLASADAFNAVLEALASFREVHYGWAVSYIQRWTDDPRGTGGTPYLPWLRQLIQETRDYKLLEGP